MSKWTGGYEGGEEDERPEGDAPTSARYTVILTPFMEATSGRILRDGETVGTFSADTEEEARWLAKRVTGSFTLPKKYD